MTVSPIARQRLLKRIDASATDSPVFGLASVRSQKLPFPRSPALCGATMVSADTGTVISAVWPTVAPTNPGGLTPMMVAGAPLSSTVSPIARGLRTNCRSQ